MDIRIPKVQPLKLNEKFEMARPNHIAVFNVFQANNAFKNHQYAKVYAINPRIDEMIVAFNFADAKRFYDKK